MVIQQMRKEMVDQKDGMSRLTVKVHMDDMKRVEIREQDYFYHNISKLTNINQQRGWNFEFKFYPFFLFTKPE